MVMNTMTQHRSIVRSYSFEVEQRLPEGHQARPLGLALVAERENGSLDEITTPWRAFFETRVTETAPMSDFLLCDYDSTLPCLF